MEFIANRMAKPDRAAVRARRASPFVAAAIATGLLAAGCGGSSPTRTAASRTATALKFSKCMRAHGVPNFPDPGSSISGPYNSIGAIEIPTAIDTKSPAFQTAQNACHGLLSAALSRQGRPAISASMKGALIAHAQCRSHGAAG